ncbi:MAG: hypothetical protein MHM6MM_005556 [Cercozoa sp. M6MM]
MRLSKLVLLMALCAFVATCRATSTDDEALKTVTQQEKKVEFAQEPVVHEFSVQSSLEQSPVDDIASSTDSDSESDLERHVALDDDLRRTMLRDASAFQQRTKPQSQEVPPTPNNSIEESESTEGDVPRRVPPVRGVFSRSKKHKPKDEPDVNDPAFRQFYDEFVRRSFEKRRTDDDFTRSWLERLPDAELRTLAEVVGTPEYHRLMNKFMAELRQTQMDARSDLVQNWDNFAETERQCLVKRVRTNVAERGRARGVLRERRDKQHNDPLERLAHEGKKQRAMEVLQGETDPVKAASVLTLLDENGVFDNSDRESERLRRVLRSSPLDLVPGTLKQTKCSKLDDPFWKIRPLMQPPTPRDLYRHLRTAGHQKGQPEETEMSKLLRRPRGSSNEAFDRVAIRARVKQAVMADEGLSPPLNELLPWRRSMSQQREMERSTDSELDEIEREQPKIRSAQPPSSQETSESGSAAAETEEQTQAKIAARFVDALGAYVLREHAKQHGISLDAAIRAASRAA